MNKAVFRKNACLFLKIFFLLLLIIKLLTNARIAVSEALRYPSGSADFQWDSAKLFIMRLNPYKQTLFNLYSDVGQQFKLYYGDVVCNQLPSALCMLIPWTIFGPVSAKLAWLISNCIFIVVIAVGFNIVIFKDLSTVDKIIWNMVWISSIPLLITIEMGQHLPFSIAGFILSVVFAEKAYTSSDSEKAHNVKNLMLLLSGCFLAISYFKYTVTFITLIFFIYKRYWKPVVISGLIHIGLTVFSSFWIKAGVFEMVKDSLMISSSTGMGSKYDLMALIGNGIFYKLTVVLLMVFLLYLAFKRKKTEDERYMALLFSFSLILVYHRSYDFFVMIVPAFSLFTHLIKNSRMMKIPEKVYIFLTLFGIWIIFFYNTILKHIIPLNSQGWDLFNDVMTFCGLYMTCAYFVYLEINSLVNSDLKDY